MGKFMHDPDCSQILCRDGRHDLACRQFNAGFQAATARIVADLRMMKFPEKIPNRFELADRYESGAHVGEGKDNGQS